MSEPYPTPAGVEAAIKDAAKKAAKTYLSLDVNPWQTKARHLLPREEQ